jgi:WhiB family redox-sensing transcriptional regulator
MAQAACRGLGSEINFSSARGEPLESALELCARCEVRPACLEYALSISAEPLLPGIWAATSERGRRRLRRCPGGPRGSLIT